MKARILELLRAHWPLLLALAVGIGIGWYAARGGRSETITESVDSHATAAASGTSDSHLARGPVDVEIDVGGWAPPVLPVFPDAQQGAPAPRAPPGQAATVWRPQMGVIPDCLPPGTKIRIHEGPSTEESHASTQSVAMEDTHRELKEATGALARVSLFAGAQLRPDTRAAVGGGVRLFGPAWAEVVVVPNLSDPLKSSVVAGLRWEFR